MSEAASAGDRVPQAELVRIGGLFQSGRHVEMEAAALVLVRTCPNDGTAWKAWGTALLLLGRDALAAMHRARELLPQDVEVMGSLGVILGRLGRWREAERSHRSAIAARPGLASAHCNLADALAGQGEWAAAAASCREALRLRPRFAEAFANLGRAEAALGRPAEAADCYQRALAIQPALAQARHGLALAWMALDRRDEAATELREAVRLRPLHAAAWWELAMLDAARGDLDRAETAYRRALTIEPERHEAWSNLGDVLMRQGLHQEALDMFGQALERRPGEAALLGNLGNALLADNRIDAALQAHAAAVAAAPDDAVRYANLAHACIVAGEPERALVQLDLAVALEPRNLDWRSARLFANRYRDQDQDDGRRSLAAAREYGALATAGATPFVDWPRLGDPDRRLRVGLVSGDLRAHPVAWFLRSVVPVLATRAGLELRAYATRAAADTVTETLRASFASWDVVEQDDDAALAARIHRDGIDLLIDLSGHTRHNRLPVFAWRPAPLQLSWLGSCTTTGLTEIDAVVVDRAIAPPGTESRYVEKLLRMPHCFLCFAPPDLVPVAPEVGPRDAEAPIRLACFNRLAKIGEAVIAAWSRILLALPGATLALQDRALADSDTRDRWVRRFAAHGIGRERLSCRPALSHEAYLAGYGAVDIALDPFPYPGGTTSLEALWMGVPVLTLAGGSPLARQGATLLQGLGLADWVGADVDDYVDKAVRFARARRELDGLKAGLRERLIASPLCDATLYASALEQAWRELWRRRCTDGPAGHEAGP